MSKATKIEKYPGVQEAFDAAVKAQVKSCFLAIQTVLKRVQDLQNQDETQTFVHLIKKVINWLEILDLESFQIGIKSLTEMKDFCDDSFFQDQKFVFDAYLSVWSSIYNFANKIYSKGCEYTCHCAQAFKIILDYQYSDGKDQDEEQDSKDDGQAQDGCGLGDGDGGEASTKDVESEDIFESAERPQPQNDDQDDQPEEQEPRKEEDGFEVDNVEDENPQAPSDNENEDQNESEDEDNEDKEQELDAEEGKADENVDEDFWDNEQEQEEEQEQKQRETKATKAAAGRGGAKRKKAPAKKKASKAIDCALRITADPLPDEDDVVAALSPFGVRHPRRRPAFRTRRPAQRSAFGIRHSAFGAWPGIRHSAFGAWLAQWAVGPANLIMYMHMCICLYFIASRIPPGHFFLCQVLGTVNLGR